MSGPDLAIFGDSTVAARVGKKFAALETPEFLRFVIEDMFKGRIALVSSFGADTAVLLHMVSKIDRALPIIFVDTLQLFPETLAYRERLIDFLGLTNVITSKPDAEELGRDDPENFLWARDPDLCCKLRKVKPLVKAVQNYEAWISGRKRFQAQSRSTLPFFETEGDRVKVNPLALWSQPQLDAYFETHDLPRHDLFAKGYLSIGCIPCTSPVKPGEDGRAGRWRGRGKTECGIHTTALTTSQAG
jgi:phosphoadenosine phosphosulfate reductase